jgi:hypothetical protein
MDYYTQLELEEKLEQDQTANFKTVSACVSRYIQALKWLQ